MTTTKIFSDSPENFISDSSYFLQNKKFLHGFLFSSGYQNIEKIFFENINKLDNKQKNELIFFLLDNKSFKGLLNTWKPTKKDYFAWLDKTFGI